MVRRTREKYTPPPPPPPTRAMVLFPGRVGLTIEEFAEASGLTTTAIEAAIAEGRLRHGRLGREVRIRIDMLDLWFEGKLAIAPVEAAPPDLSAFSAPVPLPSSTTQPTPEPSVAESVPAGPPCPREGCPGHLRAQAVMRLLERPSGPLVIKDIPAQICDTCGDTTLTSEVARRLAKMAQRRAPIRVGDVPLCRYVES